MPRTDLNSAKLNNQRNQLIRKKDGKGLFDLMYEVYSNSYDSRLKNDGKISSVDEKCEDTAENFLELIASTNKDNDIESEPSGEVHESRKDILKSFIDSLNEQYYLTVINLGEKRNMWEDRIKKGFFEETKYAQNDPEAVKKIAHNIVLSSETDAHSILEIKSRLLSSIAGKTIDGKSVEEYFRESDENARKKVMGTKKVSEKKLDKYIQDFENNKYYEEVGFKANGYEYEKGRPFFKEVPEVNPRLFSIKYPDEMYEFENRQLEIIEKYETYIRSIGSVSEAAKQYDRQLDEYEKKNQDNPALKEKSYEDMRKGIKYLMTIDPMEISPTKIKIENYFDVSHKTEAFAKEQNDAELANISNNYNFLCYAADTVGSYSPTFISDGKLTTVNLTHYKTAKQNQDYIREARREKKMFDLNDKLDKDNAFSRTLNGQIKRLTDSCVNNSDFSTEHGELISEMLKCERLYNRYWAAKKNKKTEESKVFLNDLNSSRDKIKSIINDCKMADEGTLARRNKQVNVLGKPIDRFLLYDNIMRNLDRAHTLNPKDKNPENVELPVELDAEKIREVKERILRERDERFAREEIELKKNSFTEAINGYNYNGISAESRDFVIKSYNCFENKDGSKNSGLKDLQDDLQYIEGDEEKIVKKFNKRFEKYKEKIKEEIGGIKPEDRSEWQTNAYNALLELESPVKKEEKKTGEDKPEKQGMAEKEEPELIGMPEKDAPEKEQKLDFLEKASDGKKTGKASKKDSPVAELIDVSLTARDYINNLRDNGFKVINTSYIDDAKKDEYGDKFLKIIAARQLAGSQRNDPDKLKKVMVTTDQVNQRVAEMKEDEVFKGFIDSIKKSKYKMITAINGAKMKPGHGGKLDDMLKDYMLNLPPGELKNTKLHERYMPSVDERIEKIKKQVEKLQKKQPKSKKEEDKNKDQLVKAVAEIIVLRNLAQAEPGKKESLAKTLSCSQDDVLKSKVETLAKDEAFRTTALNRNIQKLLVARGHGGKMTTKVRELYSENLEKQGDITDIIEENTIDSRMKQLKKKAGELATSIKNAQPGSAAQNEQIQAGKDLMEEYSLLYAKIVDPDSFEVVQDKLKKDVPWGRVAELKTKDTTFTRKFRYVTGYFNLADVEECLDKMSKQKVEDYLGSVNAKINEVNQRIKNAQKGDNIENNEQEVVMAQPKVQKKGGKQKK